MKSRKTIILSGVALAVLVAMLSFSSAPIALATPVGGGYTPSTSLSVFVIKKQALICDEGASAPPSQSPPEIGGCIDVDFDDDGLQDDHGIEGYRFNEYLFAGEQLAELVVARDLNGAEFLASTASMMVDGASKVTCLDVTDKKYQSGTHWYGHDVTLLLDIMPPQQGVIDKEGFDARFDKVYECLMTVTPSMVGSPSSVSVQVSELSGTTARSVVQKWYFNPAISISVSFDSGTSVSFPPAMAGQIVYSTNTLMIGNTAAGGVDLAVYITGHDLKDSSNIGICPTTNVLNINNMEYRCKVGTYMSEVYTPICHLKEANECKDLSDRQCLVGDECLDGATPLGGTHNDLIPDAQKARTSILYNGHTAECWFRLSVPVPCIGTYSASDAVDVLVRAI